MSLPPLAPLCRVLDALEDAGLSPVVGGSALLVALGVADVANDWDVVLDADPDAVEAALAVAGIRAVRAGSAGRYLSAALFSVDADDAEIDVIVDFAIRADDGSVIRIPARPGAVWRGLPMARPDDWRTAYLAMGRPERAALLERHESSGGPSPRSVGRGRRAPSPAHRSRR